MQKHRKYIPVGIALLILFSIFLVRKDRGRGNLSIQLADGRYINAVACQLTSPDLLKVTFQNGVESFVPTKLLHPKKAEKYLDGSVHTQGSVEKSDLPAPEYPVADWFTEQPVELIALIKSDSYGEYKSDVPYQESLIPKGTLEGTPDAGVTLSDLRYYPGKRSLANFSTALANELPKTLSKPRLAPGLDGLLSTALSLDRQYAVAIAEAMVRFAPKNDYVHSVELLCEVYFRAGEKEKLTALVKAPEKWILKSKKTKIFDELQLKSDDGFAQSWFEVQLALLSGADAKEVERLLTLSETAIEEVPPKKQAKLRQLVTQARNRQTFSKKPYEALGEQDRERLESIAKRYDTKLKMRDVPLLERYAFMSEADILAEIKVHSQVYGNMSNQTADLILYLMEQRGYDGVGISVGDLLWGGIHTKGAYGKKRSLPIFSLAQKTAVLNPGPSHSKQTLSNQFGVEAGLYFSEAMKGKDAMLEMKFLHAHLMEITEKSIKISKSSPVHSAAGHYRTSMTRERWGKMAQLPEYRDQLINEFDQHLEDKDPAIRIMASKGSVKSTFYAQGYKEGMNRVYELMEGSGKYYIKIPILNLAVNMALRKGDSEGLEKCSVYFENLRRDTPEGSPEIYTLKVIEQKLVANK